MRLVKELAGIKHALTASPLSHSARFPISKAGSSKKAKIVFRVGRDVTLECTGPVSVDFGLCLKFRAKIRRALGACIATTNWGRDATHRMPPLCV